MILSPTVCHDFGSNLGIASLGQVQVVIYNQSLLVLDFRHNVVSCLSILFHTSFSIWIYCHTTQLQFKTEKQIEGSNFQQHVDRNIYIHAWTQNPFKISCSFIWSIIQSRNFRHGLYSSPATSYKQGKLGSRTWCFYEHPKLDFWNIEDLTHLKFTMIK